VNRIVPHLDQIAANLTERQNRFRFQAVSMSAPIGTWRTERSGDGTYLDANRIAARLKSKPDEVGVEKLICITNLPLRDSRTLDIYAWDDDPRIAIFSTRDLLDKLNPPLLMFERMVANAVAGFVCGLETDQRHNKNCPNFYNEDREIASIAGKLKLCPVCRRKIKDAEMLKAIDGLLDAY
jgi:hypothetical protein